MQNLEGWIIPQFGHQLKFVLEWREKGVAAFDLAFHHCQVKVGAARQGLFVNFRAAADENIGGELHRDRGFPAI